MCSLYLMGDSSQMNRVEREEMKRRTLTMLLYLLRSPFYDRYSKLVTFHTQLECTYTQLCLFLMLASCCLLVNVNIFLLVNFVPSRTPLQGLEVPGLYSVLAMKSCQF